MQHFITLHHYKGLPSWPPLLL